MDSLCVSKIIRCENGEHFSLTADIDGFVTIRNLSKLDLGEISLQYNSLKEINESVDQLIIAKNQVELQFKEDSPQ